MTNPTTPNEKLHVDINKSESDTKAEKQKHRSEAGWNPERKLCDLPESETARFNLDKVCALLLEGKRLSRLTLSEHGMRFNGSLHTYVPNAERKFDLPIAREKNANTGVNDYWMEEDVRSAAANPATRKVMACQFRRKLEQKMLKNGMNNFERVLARLELYPELIGLHPWAEAVLHRLLKRVKTILGERP